MTLKLTLNCCMLQLSGKRRLQDKQPMLFDDLLPIVVKTHHELVHVTTREMGDKVSLLHEA